MNQVTDWKSQEWYLSVLSQADAGETKAFVNDLLAELPEVEVLKNQTGLVMIPCKDTVQGTEFHLGEALVAEAWIRMQGVDGYAACLGRDLEQAMAIAVLDAAIQAGLHHERIEPFLRETAQKIAEAEETLMRKVESTRVEMETFV